MSDRMKAQAAKNRGAAKVLRGRGKGDAAKRMEDRADELESGRVTDQTDTILSAWRWARRG
ncbi:hypothetical protein O3Q52_20105 [Streptomyces sp. ActVer]|uniref:hypothetical protein n=1 Tax=Streptomyces sp. ActVer TaxID=3014558 RepID=UPI0022B3C4A3|nr:hypothetical protein [Streptomyces sp. ActVer]MCZ4510451.1 hypothetical protein [Streptomyces sp. ActVer]